MTSSARHTTTSSKALDLISSAMRATRVRSRQPTKVWYTARLRSRGDRAVAARAIIDEIAARSEIVERYTRYAGYWPRCFEMHSIEAQHDLVPAFRKRFSEHNEWLNVTT